MCAKLHPCMLQCSKMTPHIIWNYMSSCLSWRSENWKFEYTSVEPISNSWSLYSAWYRRNPHGIGWHFWCKRSHCKGLRRTIFCWTKMLAWNIFWSRSVAVDAQLWQCCAALQPHKLKLVVTSIVAQKVWAVSVATDPKYGCATKICYCVGVLSSNWHYDSNVEIILCQSTHWWESGWWSLVLLQIQVATHFFVFCLKIKLSWTTTALKSRSSSNNPWASWFPSNVQVVWLPWGSSFITSANVQTLRPCFQNFDQRHLSLPRLLTWREDVEPEGFVTVGLMISQTGSRLLRGPNVKLCFRLHTKLMGNSGFNLTDDTEGGWEQLDGWILSQFRKLGHGQAT